MTNARKLCNKTVIKESVNVNAKNEISFASSKMIFYNARLNNDIFPRVDLLCTYDMVYVMEFKKIVLVNIYVMYQLSNVKTIRLIA